MQSHVSALLSALQERFLASMVTRVKKQYSDSSGGAIFLKTMGPGMGTAWTDAMTAHP